MVTLCKEYERLPPPLKDALFRAAAVTYLKWLISRRRFGEALRFLVSYGSRLGLPTVELERLEQLLRLYDVIERAESLAKTILDEIRLGVVPSKSTIREAERLADEIEASLTAWASRDVREAAERLARLLRDARLVPRIIEDRRRLEEALRRARDVVNMLVGILGRLADAASRGDYEAVRRLMEEQRRAAEEDYEVRRILDSVAKDLEEIAKSANSNMIRDYASRLARQTRLVSRLLLELVVEIGDALGAVYRLLESARELREFVEFVRSGGNVLEKKPLFGSAVIDVLSAEKAARELEERASRVPSELRELVRVESSGRALSVFDAIRDFARSIKEAAAKLYKSMMEIAAHNDDLWNELVESTRAVGFAVPARPSVPWWQSFLDFINTWLQRFSFEANVYYRAAAHARNILEALKLGALAFLSYFAKHVTEIFASIPVMVAEGISAAAREIGYLMKGEIGKAVMDRVRLVESALRSLIPRLENPLDAAAFIAALAAAAYLLSEARVPIPRSVLDLPVVGRVVRVVTGGEISALTPLDVALPEVSLVLRGVGEAVKLTARGLGELLERLRGRPPDVVVAEIGRELEGIELSGEALAEYARELRNRLVEEFEKLGLSRDEALRAAAKLIERIRRYATRPEASSIIKSVAKAGLEEATVLTDLLHRIAGVKRLEEILTVELARIRGAIEHSEISRLTEARSIIENVEHFAEDARRLLEQLDEYRELIVSVFDKRGEELIKRLEEAVKKLNEEDIKRARELVRLASGLMGRLEELKKTLADAVRRLFHDEEIARMIMEARTPEEAISAALRVLERHPGSPIRALEELARVLRDEWSRIEPLYARLAAELGARIGFRVEAVASREIAKARLVRIEEIPRPLRDILSMFIGGRRYVTLYELAEVLSRIPEVIKGKPLAYVQGILRALDEIRGLIEEACNVAREYGASGLAERLREAYREAREYAERTVERILREYRATMETLHGLARLLREYGLEDAARLVEEAVEKLPNTDEFSRLLLEAERRIEARLRSIRRLPRRLIESLKGILERLRGEKPSGILAKFAADLESLVRELEATGGVVGYIVKIGRYDLRAVRGMTAEDAEALARMVEEGGYRRMLVKIGNYVFAAERRVRVEPGRLILEYRVYGPGGYWEVVREVIDVVCRGGRCYADIETVKAYDPRLPEELRPILDYAVSRAIEEDRELLGIGDRIIVVMEEGSRRLSEILEDVARRLAESGRSIAKLLMMSPPPPFQALGLATLPPIERIGNIVRRIVFSGNGITVEYVTPIGKARIRIVDGRVDVSGRIDALIEALSVDKRVRKILSMMLPPVSMGELRAMPTVKMDGIVLHIATPEELLRFVINPQFERRGYTITIRYINLPSKISLPAVVIRVGGETRYITVQPPGVRVTPPPPGSPPPTATPTPLYQVPSISLEMATRGGVTVGRPAAELYVI